MNYMDGIVKRKITFFQTAENLTDLEDLLTTMMTTAAPTGKSGFDKQVFSFLNEQLVNHILLSVYIYVVVLSRNYVIS